MTSGLPGAFRKHSGAETAGALHLAASPARAYDSRPGEGTSEPKGRLAGLTAERTIDLTFSRAIRAVLVNVTVTETLGPGFLSIFSNAVAFPGTSTVNWSTSGENVSNGAVVAVDGTGKAKVRVSGDTHFLVDVSGYYL